MSELETLPTTQVALKIIETKPAVVSFNYDEISDHLDSVLVKYQGLFFTESTASECKKTIAELRKGQKALDEFRKATKKQLTESVTNFEFLCKVLYKKFDSVIQPLTTQQDQFELDRREKKRVEIQSIIDAYAIETGLSEKFVAQLIILEDYFSKGKTIKSIKTELSALAASLKIQQDKEAQDEDLIKTKVELANAQYQLTNGLMPEPYLRLLFYSKPVSEIEALIASDAQQVKEREDKAAEVLAAKPIEAPIAEATQAEPEPDKMPEFLPSMGTPVPASNFMTKPAPSPVFTPARVRIENLTTAVYEITGTEEQLSALEAYLDANNYTWIDRPNE